MSAEGAGGPVLGQASRLTVVGLPGLPEIRPGDDLAALLLQGVAAAGERLRDGDVLAVTSKVVAKAEGRLVRLPADPAERARVQEATVAAETVRVVARRGPTVIAETRHGLVGANALVDASNAGGDALVLLPADPDASAARLRASLQAASGCDVAVVVTDTLGRPWRLGQTDAAVGLAGMGALEDYRGRPDADGRMLEVTEVAVADEVAAAADLVKGKVAGVPAALLRGVPRPAGKGSARDLVRPAAQDLFRSGATAADLAAFVESLPAVTRFRPDPVEEAVVERAAAAAATVEPAFRVVQAASAAARSAVLAVVGSPAGELGDAPLLLVPGLAAAAPSGELAAGRALQSLLLALHAYGIGSAFTPVGPAAAGALAAALDVGQGWRPVGLIAAGQAADSGGSRPPAPTGALVRR